MLIRPYTRANETLTLTEFNKFNDVISQTTARIASLNLSNHLYLSLWAALDEKKSESTIGRS